MSISILVMGESGTGKSTSIRTLDPKETLVIQVEKERLPFRENNNFFKKKCPPEKKHLYIKSILKYVNNEKKEIKTIVIDDFHSTMVSEYMNRATEYGYQKFTDLALHVYDLIEYSKILRDDLFVFFLTHSELDQNMLPKVRTIGKLLDDKIIIPSKFNIVLYSTVSNHEYKFQTNFSQNVKSPMGMFEEEFINNDLNFVKEKVIEYYKLNHEEETKIDKEKRTKNVSI